MNIKLYVPAVCVAFTVCWDIWLAVDFFIVVLSYIMELRHCESVISPVAACQSCIADFYCDAVRLSFSVPAAQQVNNNLSTASYG